MKTLDIIILIPLLYFAFRGFTKGFVITLAMLAGLLLGLYAAFHFSEYTAAALSGHVHLDSGNIRLVAYLVTFVTVIVLVYLLGQFLTRVLKTAGLGLLNRLAGLVLGIAKGVLIICALVVLLSKIDPKSYLISPESKSESVLYKPISAIAVQVFPLMEKYTHEAKEIISGEEKQKPRKN